MNYKCIMRIVGIFILSVLATQNVDAARLTPQQALSRAQSSSIRMRVPASGSYELTYTEKTSGVPALYVFNKGEKGFIIASADDRMPALLGYSDNGAFDPKNVSPEFKWWLGQYAGEAGYMFKNESKFSSNNSSAMARSSRAEIEPLVKTKWNQSEPYNNDCPVDAGGRCVTGCVATAMAQVINYHRYPVTGTGTHSYQWKNTTLSFDYGSTTFDWANMLDEYGENATAAQREAVAKLMYACGVGVDMSYSSESSGAQDARVPYALKEYFNYDKGVRMLDREYFSNTEWENMIYEELAAKRPVIYSGQAYNGGHSFVCDGYKDEYYHINWGWGGYCDGYFLLSALNPDGQGIGGFEGGYNSDQSAIIGIQKPTAGTTAWYPIYAMSGLKLQGTSGNYLNLSLEEGGIISYYPQPLNVTFYLRTVSQDGVEVVAKDGETFDFNYLNYWSSFRVAIPTDLEAGTYKAYLVFKTPDGNMQPILFPQGCADYVEITVDSEGNLSFGEGEPDEKAQIKVTSCEPDTSNGKVVTGVNTTFWMTIENDGEIVYTGAIKMAIFKRGSDSQIQEIGINIGTLAAGGVLNGGTSVVYELDPGEYDIIFFDKYGDKISERFPITIVSDSYIDATSITLDKTEATLVEGETVTLTATIDPETTTDKTVTWSSSDEAIATVNAEGVITAVKAGTATITATTSNGHKAECVVTVKAKVIEAEGIALDKTEATLVEGETLTLTATIDPETTTDKTVTWSSSDETVATVNAEGVVTAVKAGTATITAATSNGHKAECVVTVKSKVIEAAGIALDKTEATLVEGETLTLTATIDPETTTDKTVTWSSSDETVATVNAEGVVTAVKAGTATITATTINGHKAECAITVKAKVIEAAGIALDKTEATLVEGESVTLTATIDPATTTDKTVTWSSSDEAIAKVDSEGVVTAVKAGTATITATTSNGHKAECVVTVKAKVIEAAGIALDKTEATLVEGETLTLTATIDPETTTDKTVTWSSSDESVATVNAEGVVTAVKAGTATITATTSNGHKAECAVTVKAKAIEAEGIALDKTEATLVEGETLTLTATIDPATTTDKTVTWSSSDETVATVNAEGVVTAVKVGTATITATTSNGLKAECAVTVKAKVIEAEGIALDKTEATLVEGETLTLTATIDPETTTDKTVTWSSSDETVAKVDSEGVVTAVKAGTATITATTSNGHKAECVVTVKSKVIEAEGIALDKTEATLVEGETLTLTATIDPETTTDKTVTWSSSDEAIAKVDSEGVVTAVKAGTATITATTSNGHKAECVVTVKAKVIEAEGIALDKTEATLVEGQTLTLIATVDPETTTDKTVTWSSSDETVATVNAEGVVTAVKAGTATITAATSNGLKAECAVTVKAKVIEAEGIALDKTEATLVEDETLTLTATIDPDTTTDKTVTWSSSDETVATVNAEGVVTAVKAGTATITAATSNGHKAECVVTVKSKVIEAEGIALDKTEATLVEGETLTLTATIDPETTTDKTVTWSSSDETVATVNAEGVVTAVKAGTATIAAATSNGHKAECAVTVKAKVIEAAGIALDKTEATLVEGESVTLTATIDPATTTDKTVTWSSSDESVATVNAEGVVTAVKAGTVTIAAATSNGLKAECVVTVKAKVIEAEGIALDKTEATLVVGETLTLTATIDPETTTDKTVTWSSSDETVATVNAEGVVTAVKAGTATIAAATSNGHKAECAVTVKAKVIEAEGIALDKTEATFVEGETLTLTATIDPETTTDKTVTWSSSDETVATVNAEGVVTAVKAGTAIITATTTNGLIAECEVTVEPAIILVTSITLSQETIEAEPGMVVQLIATVGPEDATDKTIIWTSSDENVAIVYESGLVNVISEGTATITATAADGSGVSATCHVSGLSGIESLIEKEGNADVYTMNGLLLKRNADREYISTLAKGVYILNISGKVYKVVQK